LDEAREAFQNYLKKFGYTVSKAFTSPIKHSTNPLIAALAEYKSSSTNTSLNTSTTNTSSNTSTTNTRKRLGSPLP